MSSRSEPCSVRSRRVNRVEPDLPRCIRVRPRLCRALLWSVSIGALALWAQPTVASPLTKPEVVKLLRRNVQEQRILAVVRELGIDFKLTAPVMDELISEGASAALVAELMELASPRHESGGSAKDEDSPMAEPPPPPPEPSPPARAPSIAGSPPTVVSGSPTAGVMPDSSATAAAPRDAPPLPEPTGVGRSLPPGLLAGIPAPPPVPPPPTIAPGPHVPPAGGLMTPGPSSAPVAEGTGPAASTVSPASPPPDPGPAPGPPAGDPGSAKPGPPGATSRWDEVKPLLERADALATQGDVRGAQRLLAEAIEIDPGEPAVWKAFKGIERDLLAEAETFLANGEVQRALRQFEFVIQKNPESAPGHYSKGRALAQLKNYDEAVAALERAVALNPGNVRYRQELARARNLQKASRTMERRGQESLQELLGDQPWQKRGP